MTPSASAGTGSSNPSLIALGNPLQRVEAGAQAKHGCLARTQCLVACRRALGPYQEALTSSWIGLARSAPTGLELGAVRPESLR